MLFIYGNSYQRDMEKFSVFILEADQLWYWMDQEQWRRRWSPRGWTLVEDHMASYSATSHVEKAKFTKTQRADNMIIPM